MNLNPVSTSTAHRYLSQGGRLGTRRWNLDNTALIFPSVATPDDPHVYRVTCIMCDEVDPGSLQRALDEILPYFDAFTVGISRGAFWRRFERIRAVPSVAPDSGELCAYFDFEQAELPLFRLLYSGSSIHLELFHALTDGVGALRFIKAVVYRYCQLAHPERLDPAHRYRLFGLEQAGGQADGYAHPRLAKPRGIKVRRTAEKPAYQIKGELLPSGQSRVQVLTVPVEAVKQSSRRYGVSLGVYLTAALASSIGDEFDVPASRPVGICVPVNLRPVFEVETDMNFFANTLVQLSHRSMASFGELVAECQRQFDENTSKERFQKLVSQRVRLENSPLAKMTPLGFKDFTLSTAYRLYKRRRTTTFSNLGVMSVEEAFTPFFKGFTVCASTAPNEPVRLTVSSFGDEMTLAITSKLADEGVGERLLERLVEAR